MSGHSKWAGIKHKKAVVDAQRGRLFSKLVREVILAAKTGGDPNANARLRHAIEKAKEANLPNEKIDNAILKGTGKLPGQALEEVTYEGYGPGGVALLVQAVTDNKNRTTSDIRNLFDKRGGNLAGAGSVSWIFQQKGFFLIEKRVIDEEALLAIALDHGGEDVKLEGDTFEVTTALKDFERLKAVFQGKKVPVQTAELTMLPTTTVRVAGEPARHILELVESLEAYEDVQNVYANFDIPDEILQASLK